MTYSARIAAVVPQVYKMVMSIGWNPFYNNKEKTAEPWILHDFDEVRATHPTAAMTGCSYPLVLFKVQFSLQAVQG